MLAIYIWITFSSTKITNLLRVDLNKAYSSQSQTYPSGDSHLAYDGNVETCALAEKNSAINEPPWWRAKLDRIYNITDISLSLKKQYKSFLNYLEVYISSKDHNFDEHLCAAFRKFANKSSRKIHLNCTKPSLGNFVTIKRVGGLKRTFLILCEVKVNADGRSLNLAFKRPTDQSGIYFKSDRTYAVDNDFETCAAITSYIADYAWWRVVLDKSYYITNVDIYFKLNIQGSNTSKFLNVFVSNDGSYFEAHSCGYTEPPNVKLGVRGLINITCYKPTLGNYVTVKKYGGQGMRWLILCEVEIFSRHDPPELNTNITSEDCHDHEYKCHNANCIHKDWLCDSTFDCPLGDDEAPSCQKCGDGKFKCTRRNLCVDNSTRCDGKADCPDFSDEYGCFKVQSVTNFLIATYGGKSDFYVCSKNWKIPYSLIICGQLKRIYSETYYEPISDEPVNVVTLEQANNSEDFPDMTQFRNDLRCETQKIVKLECEYVGGLETTGLCGTRGYPDAYYEPYIINGNEARDGAWPWQVQIFVDDAFTCGGSIVNENWILTAAHCYKNRIKRIYVKIGTNELGDPYAVTHNVTQIVSHPNFINDSSGDDIALLKLKPPIRFTQFIKPICLPERVLKNRTLMSYRHCVVTGYGYIDQNQTLPLYLQQGRMNIISDEDCLNYLDQITPFERDTIRDFLKSKNLFCAGSIPTKEGINTCRGDSGGPLVCKNEQRIWTQIGIVDSFVEDNSKLPCTNSFFTKVDLYAEFIQNALSMDFDSKK